VPPAINSAVGRTPPRRGFTLVELVTATSLMTVMMLGVVQIFAFITDTAAQAQGMTFALEQQRALMDTLHRDIRGLDRTGYLFIRKADLKQTQNTDGSFALTPGTFTRPAPTKSPLGGQNWFWDTDTQGNMKFYCNDLLAMTTAGSFWEKRTDDRSANAETAAGAEVVYSSNVKTPDARLRIGSGMSAPQVDQRRSLLGRGVWVFRGGDSWGGAWSGTGSDSDVRSKAALLTETVGTSPKDRMSTSDGGSSGGLVSPVRVWPVTAVGAPLNSWSLRRVAASCASEFYVEVLDLSGSVFSWKRQDMTIKPGVGSTATAICPRAIRVTVAVHDPGDKTPAVGLSSRFEGFAVQEVFWIGDP